MENFLLNIYDKFGFCLDLFLFLPLILIFILFLVVFLVVFLVLFLFERLDELFLFFHIKRVNCR